MVKSYYDTHPFSADPKENGKDFTVIQPIVSGDSQLELCLKTNVLNGGKADFIWVIDRSDDEAAKITNKIIKEVPEKEIRVIIADQISCFKNEKVCKQKLALPYARKYFIAADDDAILSFPALFAAKNTLEQGHSVITSLPYYRPGNRLLSNLVVGFVNGNTLLTYLVIAKLGMVSSLNGMCYAAKKSTFVDLNLYETVEEKLSDEYEIAKVLLKENINIVQSTIPCSVGTTIFNLSHYLNLMKRWMVFANIYMAEKIGLSTFVTIVMPTALPLIFFIFILLTGNLNLFPLLISVQLIMALMNYLQRRQYFKNQESLTILLFEIISSYLQPIHYLHSLIRPNTVIWRKNKVTLTKQGYIQYEKTGEDS